MKFRKQGLIYCPRGELGWNNKFFMTPTPLRLNEDIIRIYGGMRDASGVSRIGYIDVDAGNPSHILKISKQPSLNIGKPGTFDDNGIILGSILPEADHIKMYYVGFQLVQKVKFLAFSGLAISNDGGETFYRYSDVPIFDRFDDEYYIRAIHTVRKENGIYRIWYSYGNSWQMINNISYPIYKIRCIDSADGIIPILNTKKDCIDVIDNEYRIGRPTVFYEDGLYKMFYTKDTLSKKYSPGMGISEDGKTWQRCDEDFELNTSTEGWDSQMVCYPILIKGKKEEYLIYSGNNMGESGVGYAIREE